MRGDKLKGASIIDLDGKERFQIVPNVWVKIMVGSFIMLLTLCFVLALMAVLNRYDIDALKLQVDTNANTATNSTR